MSFTYINTRDELGIQETFNELLKSNSNFTTFTDDSVVQLRRFLMYNNDIIESLIFPNAIDASYNSIQTCKNLHTLVMKKNTQSAAIDHAIPKLTHLILLDDSAVSSKNPITSQFSSDGNPPPLAFNIGAFYVPNNLVNDYKNATNWSVYANMIHSIDEYDPEVIYFNDTITDSWAQILTNENNGTYSTKYHIGDTKTFESNGQYYKMKIIAFDTDILSDNSGHAKITWLSQFLYGGAYSPIRNSYLSPILNYIEDPDLAAMIKTVQKPTMTQKNSSSSLVEEIQNLEIWFLSAQELNILGYETQGITYNIFTNNASRKIAVNYLEPSRFDSYGARTQMNYQTYVKIGNTGETLSSGVSSSSYIVAPFGFCT